MGGRRNRHLPTGAQKVNTEAEVAWPACGGIGPVPPPGGSRSSITTATIQPGQPPAHEQGIKVALCVR